MTQWIKELATKHYDPNLIPGTHMVGTHMVGTHMCIPIYTHNKQNKTALDGSIPFTALLSHQLSSCYISIIKTITELK